MRTGARRQTTSRTAAISASAQTRSIRNAAIAAAARSAVAGPALTGSRTSGQSRRRAARRRLRRTRSARRPDGPAPGERIAAVRCGVPSTSSKRLALDGTAVPSGADIVRPHGRCDASRTRSQSGREAHRRRSGLAVVSVQERLRERARDDLERFRVARPVSVIPPGNISAAEPVRVRRAIAREPVDEPEPVSVPARVPLDPSIDWTKPPPYRVDTFARSKRAEKRLPRGTFASTSSVEPRSRVTQRCAVPSAALGPTPPQPASASAARRETMPSRGSLHGVGANSAHGVRTDEADVAPDTGLPVRAGLYLAPVDLHLGVRRRGRLAGVVPRGDRVAVARRRLQRERLRPAGVGERRRSTRAPRRRPSASPCRLRPAARRRSP